jgi:signal transduction histidine kinase
MEIRKKITYQFTGITAGLLLMTMVVIYLLFSSYRQDDFRHRLGNKAKSIGQLVGETDSLDTRLLERLEQNDPSSLVNEKILVMDPSGTLLYQHGRSGISAGAMADLSGLKQDGTRFTRNGAVETVAYHYAGSVREVFVSCAATDLFGRQKLNQLRLILSTVFLFSLVIVYFLGRLFAAKALDPIARLVDQVDQIDISRINARIDAGSGKDEISRLSDTFNKMLGRLDAAFTIQKSFISNASHELRTPLTSITVQLDVALMQERKPKEYREIMDSVRQDIKSLNELTNKLLVLTHLRSDQYNDKHELVRIDEVLWNARTELLKIHAGYRINIFFTELIEGEHHLHCHGNATLLKTAFVNIIENGCKYSPEQQTDVHLTVNDLHCEILFRDNGVGIPPEELDHIFQPFYRAENVKKQHGHGIGLSLVERIITLHLGTVNIRSNLDQGTEVIVNLPLVR